MSYTNQGRNTRINTPLSIGHNDITPSTVRKLIISCATLIMLSGCSGGGGSSSEKIIDEIIDPPPKDTGLPIPQNQDADEYKILFFGNSHVAGQPELIKTLIGATMPEKNVITEIAPGRDYLAERLTNTESVNLLIDNEWTHLILQAQKYSQSEGFKYPTDAAEQWISMAKERDVTPIMFPEHPQYGNTEEGQYVYSLHTEIASKQLTCVSPVGLAWDKAIAIDSSLDYYHTDGNHAALTGGLLTAYVFYEIITGQPADLIPDIDDLGVDKEVQGFLRQIASETLLEHPACAF